MNQNENDVQYETENNGIRATVGDKETSSIFGLQTQQHNEVDSNNMKAIQVNDVSSLKKKYGEIYQIDVMVGGDDETDGDNLRFIFKKPSTMSFNRYIKTASKNMSASTIDFVMDNIIDEQSEELSRQTTCYPGLALNIGTKLLNALGMGDNINFKRL